MKCNSCQKPFDEGSKFCPHCGGKVLNAPSIVLCPGTPENPCGAELQESFKFCKDCGTAVDPSLFGKKREVCIECGNAFTKDGEKFCAQCGTPRQGKSDGRTTSPGEIKKRPIEKVDDDDDSSAGVQIKKAGATSLKSESGHLASSNSPVSSKANDEEIKSKKKNRKKGKKSEPPDKGKKEDQEHQEKIKDGRTTSPGEIKKRPSEKVDDDDDSSAIVQIKKTGTTSLKSESGHLASSNSPVSSKANDEEIKSKKKNRKKGKKSEPPDKGKKEDQEHQEKMKDGRTTSPGEIKKRPSEKVDGDDDSSAIVQIKKTGTTSLKSESGHLASSNSPVSSKANDEEIKSKKKNRKKGKKSEPPDKGKKEDQEHQEKKKGSEEIGENTSQIKTSTRLSSEKEDISEATQYTKQMKAKPEAEKMEPDANTDSSTENKNEKRSSPEEAKVNYIDHKTNQETKQDAATLSAEGKEGIWESDQSSSANMQTDDSAKFDKSEMNEKANNDKPNQKSDVPPKKTQGRNKNESEEKKSQNVTPQKTGGKSSSSNKTGGQGIKTDAVRVYFHAIISPEFGLVDKDKVIVRFGEQKLGGWESNEHKCTLVRYMEDDYMEFELHVNIPKEIFSRSGKRIEYKYIVLKDGVKKNPKYVWENYCTQYAKDTNRIIAMRENQAPVDEWHQYDGVVYPKVQDEGLKKKIWKSVKGFIFGDNPERHKEDLKLSLLCFQPRLFKDFSSDQKLLVPVDEAIMQLDQLKHCMRKVYYVDRKCFSSEDEYERQITVAILVPVLQSFEHLPLKDWKESVVDAERRMIKATAVLSALGCLHLKLEQDEQNLLASGLFVRPNQENKKCYDLESIDRFVTKDKKKHLSKFLKDFIEGRAMTAKDSSIFFCMPLYHFLTVEVQPFETMPYDTSHDNKDQKWWGVSSLTGAVSSFKIIQSWKVPLEEVLSILHPLFEMDYLLPRTFMAMLKLEEAEAAIRTGKIPIEVCAATLICYLKQNSANYFQKPSLVGSALHTLRDLSGKVKVTDESSNTDFIKLQMFCKIAGDLVSETLLSSAKVLLVSAVQIFLLAAANYDIMKRNKDSLESDTMQQFDHSIVLSKLYEGVKMWQHKNHQYTWEYESLLEDWNSIFAPADLPSEDVKQAWNSSAMKDLSELLRGKIARDAFKQKVLIELYCRSADSFHPDVQNCLSQLAFQVIETSYNVSMHQQGEHERKRFGGLLSSFYQREWEAALKKGDMEEDRIILYHILTWTPFSHFLKMFYGDEGKIYLLSQNCIESLVRAVSVLDDRIKTLDNGNITIQDLTVMKEAHGKFQELALIINEKSELEKPGKIFDTVKAVQVRQIEVDSYNKQMKYVTTLTQLCQYIVKVDLGAIDNKMKHLTKKKDLRVSEICQPANVETVILDNFQPKITAFELSDEVACMLEPMQKLYESHIFIDLWSEIGCQAKFKCQPVSLEEVCEKVWKPVSAEMEKITSKLVTGEIQFVEMEKYLGNIYRDDCGKMVWEMTFINVPKGQADERIKQLMQFRQLETCFNGAKAINDIVEAYGLKGDFGVIKTITSQKHAAMMMMKEFDDSLLDTCTFLQDFTLEKTQCLNVFIECKHLVLWLQESVKGGLKELKVFVDLASISAGDSPMDIARVNCLHAAITGFAPLIFDLDEISGYKELLEKCQILWKELKADPNLPKKLRDTQRHLEWLKTVKQAHGSVEVTSLAQAEAINSKGIFLVGALDTTGDTSTVLNLNSTLRLAVPDTNKDIKTHKEYTFDQLQDLQSRLMLVAGKAEQGKDDVDRFMLVSESVLRLANIFIKLNSAGCVLFRHWKTEFFCEPGRLVCALIKFGQGAKPFKGRRTDKKDLTEVVPKIAGFMEHCLEKWKDHIAKKRLEYFELNYFTTDQLVILQQELVKVTSDQFPNLRIYPLLSAVKENCTHEDLVDAMKKALTDIEKVQSEVDKEKELDAQENEQVKLDEQKVEEEEEVQVFICAMIEAGYSEKLARAALKHHKPSEIDDGILWCMTNADEFEMNESDTRSGEVPEKDNLITEITPFQGWKKSEQSVMSITADIINRLGLSESDIDVDPLIQGLEELWEAFLTSVSSSVRDYLSVEHLGVILQKLAEQDKRKVERRLPGSLVQGTPNLILCPKADVLSTVLSIYMMDPMQPLPQADEVLMCTPQTSADQLDVFLRRALADTSNKIHCVVNSDILGFEVSDCTERRLEQYMQQNKHLELQYRLVVICSAENENRSRIITSLDKFRRPPLPIPEIRHVEDYIRRKLQIKERNAAAVVDFDNSSVRVVKSWRAGVGKSLYVKRKHEELTKKKSPDHKMTDLVTIPLQEKEINVSRVTQILLSHILPPEATTPRIFHLDIAHEVQEGVDFFLFNLLILGCVTDNYGHVWRRSSRDLYLVETIPIIEKMQSQKVHYVHHIFHLLPYLTCRSPEESLNILTDEQKKPKDFRKEDQLFDEKEFQGSVFQRPYQYLSQLDKGGVIKNVNPNTPVGTPDDCLKILLNNCGVPDPSWAELHHFVWFFNTQLMDMEKSIFCSVYMAEDLPGFSKFVLRFLIQMSKDFSTRSLQISEESPTTMTEADQKKVEEESNHHEKNQEILNKYQMKRKWESSAHPYLFFNPDKNTLTFLGFYVERQTGNLIDQQNRHVLEKAIMLPKLYDSLVRNGVPIQENFDSLPRKEKIERLCRVMSDRTPNDPAKTSHGLDPDETYELTTDNVKKILAIYMKFRCNIPVIIMGETGCGKTRLIKFLCGLQTPPGAQVTNMILMKVHGGTTNADIKRKVEEARRIAQQNTEIYKDMYTVLFFDEANTTEAIGMIKEIMCDRSIEGKPLDACDNLKFVAACNPYRKHSEDFIKRLERAGLGYHVDSEKTTDKLGRIPMRRLVYRVQPLPQSLLPLVWDFGQLNTKIEDLYIRQMVKRYIEKKRLPSIPRLIEVVSEILTASQDFMRKQKNECSFVSLRDVERVLDVMSWFYAQGQGKRTLYDQMNRLILQANEGTEEGEDKRICLDDLTRALVLSLGVCYHACLKNRDEYRKHVAKIFKAPCNLPGGPDQMEQEISVCQDVFLENVQLEKNIARNAALKENVFMMVTSIELRIPLFLVGKPGSSKSLAKTIVADAMQGNAAHKDLFKEFKQVQIVSFQCSPLSTPDGIVGTFRQCAQFQKDKDLDRFVSVVVLDEVGLAEDSPRMPLKTLHPLLEDGCQGDEKSEPYKKVAFVGISNWALDPAKMNRGILVQREVPDLEELRNTAKGICSAKTHVYGLVSPFIEHLAKSYLDLFEEATEKFREFFGLRDFYSLMKMIYFFVEQTSKPPTWYQLEHSIKRNFGGLDTIDPVKAFASRLTIVDQKANSLESDPDCTAMGLIKACLYDTNKTESDSRYLLLLTENYGALTILQQCFLTRSNFITVFGSSFPSDQEYTQVCRNINRIKVCMEAGKTVVLLNLENLYESLYDALNQYYVYFGGERYVDLGLGTHRVKCRVHKDFRLIVVAEKDVVIRKFPIPLINRLEKHVLTVNTILTKEQHKLASCLEKWVKDFTTEKPPPIYLQRNERKQIVHSAGDVFIGYHADTCSSVILHVEKNLTDNNKILDEAKRLLLWCATPNYVVRLGKCCLEQEEQEEAKQAYMKDQHHENLAEYLKMKLQTDKEQDLFAQITTHSKLLSTADLYDIHQAVGISPDRIALETLQSFDTERQFSHRIRSFMDSNPKAVLLLVVQCDSGDTNANMVASARYCIQDEHQQMKERRTAPCHVVFIIQLPTIAGGCFTGFQCVLWHSAHIDDLKVQDQEMPSLTDMLSSSVGTLMKSAVDMQKLECMETDSSSNEKQALVHKLNVYSLILSCVQPALAMIRDKEETMQRSTQRIELILNLLHENPVEGIPSFLHGLSCHIAALLKEKEESSSHDADSWLSNEAAKSENINRAGTFRRACIQYLESKIFPVLAGIIAHIDTNHNLNIIRNNISSGDWKARLWLHIFNTSGAIQLQYSDLQSPTKQEELREVIVKTTGCAGQMFDAVMPFSWLIYEQVDIVWRTAQEGYGEEETKEKLEKIVASVKESLLGQVLDTLEGNVSTEEIVRLYVQDFTCIVYHTQKPEEHELVVSTIMKTSMTLQKNVSPGIVSGLVSIHESYHKIVQDLRYFRSINEVWPKCAGDVKCKLKDPQDSDPLALVNLGLSLLIQQLSPQDLNAIKNQQEWLQKVYNYRPVIEKGLACYTFTDTSKMDAAVVKAQHVWTRVVVVKLFIEHVASDKEAQKYVGKSCMAIWGVLGDTPDFKEGQSLEKVEKFLKTCNKTAIKDLLGQEPKCCKCDEKMESIPVTLPCKDAICMRCYNDMEAIHSKECPHCSKEIPSDFDPNTPASQREVQIFKDFQSRCNSFFIDIVSQLCFANNTAPSNQVMDKLLGYITMPRSSGKSGDMVTRQLTKELTIFNDCVDPNPVFRSFLLQLLLKTSTEKVTAYLEMYFKQAESMIGKDNIDLEKQMVQLCQLVVHCLEDSYYLECAEKDSVTIATKYLESAGQEMQDISVWMAGIYFIAKARFGMAVTAKHIHETLLSNKKQTVTLQQQQMIEQASTLCEGDCRWPKIFFIKYLCRCYGQDSYEAVCKNFSDTTYLGWTRYEPEEIGKVREVSDRYIVCGPHYIKIREAVTRVVLGEDIDHLDSTILDTKKDIPGNKLKILLCLTLHREITMSNLYDTSKSKVKPKAIEILQKYCSETEDFKNEDLAERILLNKYGLQSSLLNVTPGLDLKHQGILCLLMHCDLVLRNLHGDSSLLQPLVRLATQPERMEVSFIPTMPQDDVQEIREVILAYRGKDNPVFYRCPNGHLYFVGNCGRPMVERECPQCRAKIGGQSHNLLTDNKRDEGQDFTETGHILGDAELRTQCGPESRLTPVNCAVIRLLTHLTMMLGANINSQAVSEFIKPNIPKDNVPQFLWKHIEHDLDDLHRAVGKSIDDVFVIMHSILSNMLERHSETEQLEEAICSLSTKKARNDWEKKFPQKYLVPLFQNIENLLKEYNEQIALDKRLGSDPLQCLLYEVTQGQENISLTNLQEIPSMWRYQSRITMDHLHHEFDVQMTATDQKQHRVLDLFLKEEQLLRAIRYIPSILKLQRILFQKYQRKLGKAEASKITVEMLKKEPNGDEQECLLDEYAEAWDLVRENIETVPMDYRRERINKSTPVSWFLPTLSGAGLCAYSLLNFLYRKQNDFLDHYYHEINRSAKPHVRVRDITPAHLISYHPEKDILPLVLANCNYSFEMGKGTTIEYNFANLERQIMDRFLFGKSQIDIEIELMVYRAEYTNVTVFTKLQEKIPQVPLRTAAKHKISTEFHSVPDLCQALDNLDIAINFLKSIGGNAGNNLDKFMVETLKMKESLLGPKAKQICQYRHVKALWLLLSLENTKKLAHHNQVIFEGVPDQFHQQLSNELQEQVKTFLELLSAERLEVLLELMFECIVLVISVPQDPNDEDFVDPTNNKFKDYLFGLKEKKDMNQNQDTDQDVALKERDMDLAYELENFPDEVFNKFCVETWKLANQCLETRRTQT